MKKTVFALLLCFFALSGFSQSRFWISTIGGNWNNAANWSATSGGAGGATVPVAGNLAVFNGVGGRNGACLVDIAVSVNGLTVNGYTGVIDLAGNNFTTTGTNIFTTGTISNTGVFGSFILNNPTQVTTFNGTAFTTATITGTSGNLQFNGSTFSSAVTVTKANNSNDNGTGNNTFNAAVTLTNTTTATFLLGSTNKDTYNSTLTLNVNNTGAISINSGGATTHALNGNVVINYNSTGNVLFGSANGPSSLASGRTIVVGSVGASGAGNLTLNHFTTSTTAQNIALSGNTSAVLTIGPVSSFGGALTATAPSLFFTSSSFLGASTFNKNGSSVDNSVGGNTFTTAMFNNSGSGDLVLANTNPDTFNGTTVMTNSGTGRIQLGLSSAGNVVNGDLTLNHGGSTNGINFIVARNAGCTVTINGTLTLNENNGDASSGIIIANDGAVTVNGNILMTSSSGRGILFGGDTGNTGNVTLGNGFTVKEASAGSVNTGQISFYRFTQAGATPQAMTISGSAYLYSGPGTTWNGNVNFVSPQLQLNGNTFNGTASIEKNGAGNNFSVGGNTFAGATTLTNSGSGFFLMANTNPDIFNGTLTVNNPGSAIVYLAYNCPGNQFNGDVILNENGGAGIYFSNGGSGSSTMSAGHAISVGGLGFSTGQLRLFRFTQNGNAATNLPLTGTTVFYVGPSTTLGGDLNIVSPSLYFQGLTIAGNTNAEKTGLNDNYSDGGNTFNGTTTLLNSSAGVFAMSNLAADTYAGDLTASNTGTNWIFLAHNVPGNLFNGNIIVNSTSGSGIIFSNNPTGFGTQAAGKTISIGGLGYSAGELRFRRFTQLGTAAVNLPLTGTSTLRIGPAGTFGGAFATVAPNILLEGGTFNSTSSFEKNGTVSSPGNGGNIFNGIATFTNSGNGYFLTANGAPDLFNNDLIINGNSAGGLYFSHNVPGNVYNGNIIVSNTAGIGIQFSNNNTGASTQAAGKTISIGAGGFSVGELGIKRFTQNGAINLTLTGVAALRVGPNSTFGSTFNSISPQVFLDGATFAGVTSIEKNGPSSGNGMGGNIFNGVTTLTNSGSGYMMTGNVVADIFNADLTVNNTGSDFIYLGHNVPNSQFNGNIIVNETSGQGIYFSNNASGSSILAAGKTISIGGLGFLQGELRLARFTQLGSAPAQTLTLTGNSSLRVGPSSAFNSNVTFVAPQVYLEGATYSGVTYLEKNGAGGNGSTGNNIFNSTTTIVNSGSSYLRTNGGNIFNGATTLTCSGSGDLLLENISGSTYNGDVTFTNIGTSYIRSSYAGATAFNGNMIFNSTGAVGIYFCESASATATLADTKTVSVGGVGFNNGELRLQRFTQVGNTAQSLVLTSVAQLRLGPTSVFNGNVDFRAPQLFLDGTTYNGTAYLEKNGPGGNGGIGNNTFALAATIVNNGSNYLRTNGNNTFNGPTILTNTSSSDILLENTSGSTYNGDLTINNFGSSNVRMAYNGATAINGNLVVNSTSGTGITFAEIGTATATLATGKSITTGGSGFSSGSLVLQRFTQVGPTAQTLTLTANSVLYLGPTSVFNGNVNFRAPQLYLQGTTYNGIAILEKTGAVNNDSNGSNIFNGVTTLTNSGSGWLRLARNVLDQFNNDLTLTNTGTSNIYVSDNIPGSAYNGNIVVNCTLGGGIFFGNSNGSSTLATGKTISVGGLGFTIGELKLQNFTQVGGTAQNIVLTGNALIRIGTTSTWNGNVDFRAPQVLLEGATYNGTAYIEKNGAGNNTGLGNNTFNSNATFVNTASGQFRTNGNSVYNGPTTLLNSGTNDVLFELTTGSTYNGDVTFTNTGSSYIRAAYIGTNLFNGNIIVNSLNATGVFFCENTAGTAVLANTKTISIGATGFSAGELRIQRFTQTGTTAQAMVLTGSAIFRTALATTWGGNLSVTAPTLFLDGSTFNGTTSSFSKTGNSSDNSNGANIFNTNSAFTNSGTGIFRLANVSGDAFNGNASFVQTTGTLQPAYAGTNTITGNVNVTSATPIIFGGGGGTLTFAGASNTFITKGGASSPTFTRLIMNKTGNVTLSTDVLIGVNATFTSGVIFSTAANFINFANAATTSGATNASFVDGPVRKTGNQGFIFPTGNAGIYRSIAIGAPGAGTDAFTAQYFKAGQAFGGPTTYAATLVTVSSCEYWTLNRTTGTANVVVTLSWNSPDCTGAYITDLTKLRVGRWSGTQWLDNGNGGFTGNATTGTVASAPTVNTFFGPFTLASTSLANPLPITLTDFTAVQADQNVQLNWVTASELNNDHFNVERSADGFEFKSIVEIAGAGTTSQVHRYDYLDENPGTGTVYYRLRQTDFDGKSTLSKILKLEPGEITSLIAWPNPTRRNGVIQLNYTGYYVVYDSHGYQVGKTEKVNKVDVSALSAGVYLLRADNGMLVRIVVD